MNFPDIMLLQEVAKLPRDCMFHPLYMAFCTSRDGNSLGVAILLCRVSGMPFQEQHVSWDCRAIVVRVLYKSQPLQVFNLYLKSKVEAHEIRTTLEWVTPFLIPKHWYHIVGGDFNQQGEWDKECPFASPAITGAILDTFQDTNISPVEKDKPGPTWVGAQGHVRVLHHFMTSCTTVNPREAHVSYQCSFPTEHFPVVLYLHHMNLIVQECFRRLRTSTSFDESQRNPHFVFQQSQVPCFPNL